MPDPSVPQAPSPSAVTTLSLKRGDRIDAFVVVETIATTGSAVVYKAHDALLDRFVAIKQIVLGNGDSDAALRRRIHDEAAIHKRVSTSQPRHLIQFIDAVDDERGLMLVSEYYPSTSLEDLLQSTADPLAERQALGIVAATAKGLQAIHDAGVVHRDLKPSNILLGDDGGLKICDFGLAALIESQDSLSLGSVRYMAPELLKSEPADGRADIYSLGIIAYEMLAGRGHFDQAFRNVLRDQRNQAMRWMKWHTNMRVSAPPLTEFLSDTPAQLDQLVARMMDKDQARRVGSARDVLDAIRRHFTGDGDDAAELAPPPPATGDPRMQPPASRGGDTAPLPSRSKLPILLAALLLFWLVVGGSLYLVSQSRAAAAERQAVAEAEALIEEGIELYGDGRTQSALSRYEEVLDDWSPDSDLGHRAQLGAFKARGRLALDENRYDEAVAQFEAYSRAGGDASSVESAIREARDAEAFANLTAGVEQQLEAQDFQEARQIVKEARKLQWSDLQAAQLDTLEVRIETRRAQVLAEQRMAEARELAASGDYDAAVAGLEDLGEALPEEGKQLLESLKQDQRFTQAMAQADTATQTGQLGQALDALKTAYAERPDEALQTRIRQLEARLLTNQGAELFDKGEFQAAGLRFAEALEKDPDNADTQRWRDEITRTTRLAEMESRGDAAVAAGSFGRGIEAYEQALQLAPGNVTVQQKLTDALMRQSLDQARDMLDRGNLDAAQQIVEAGRVVNPDAPQLTEMLTRIQTRRQYQQLLAEADAARDAEDFGKAKRLYREADEVLPGEEVAARLQETEYREWVSKSRQSLANGNYDAARAMLRQAQRIRQSDELTELLARIETAAAEAAAANPAP